MSDYTICDQCKTRIRGRKRSKYYADYYKANREKKLAAAKTRYAEKRQNGEQNDNRMDRL